MKLKVANIQKFKDKRSYRFKYITYYRFYYNPKKEKPAIAAYLIYLRNVASIRLERLLIQLIKNILYLDFNIRPKVKDIKRSIRFIAINIITQQIDYLYADFYREDSAPQTFIKQIQFES